MENSGLKLEDVIKILQLADEQMPSDKKNPLLSNEAIDVIFAVIYTKQHLIPAVVRCIGASENLLGHFKASERRKLRFLEYYCNNSPNAAAAALYAGFKNSKSLKQQGHRVYKEIQSILRISYR